MRVIPPNTATAALRRVSFTLVDATDFVTPEDITVTGVKVTLSVDGGTPAASTNDIVKVSGTAGEYYVELTQAEANVAAGATLRGWLQPTGCALTKITARFDSLERGTDSAFLASSAPANFPDLLISESGHISRVTLVDTTTTNTDMRGTDGANTVTPPTAAAILAAIEAGTYGGRTFATILGRLGGYTGGITTVTDNGNGTHTVAFKAADGSTDVYTVTFNTTTGARTAIG